MTCKFGQTLSSLLETTKDPADTINVDMGDGSCYRIFQDIFEGPMTDSSNCDPYQPNSPSFDFDFGGPPQVNAQDESLVNGMTITTRIRLARNLADFPFSASINKDQLIQVKELVLQAIEQLPSEYKGRFISVEDVS